MHPARAYARFFIHIHRPHDAAGYPEVCPVFWPMSRSGSMRRNDSTEATAVPYGGLLSSASSRGLGMRRRAKTSASFDGKGANAGPSGPERRGPSRRGESPAAVGSMDWKESGSKATGCHPVRQDEMGLGQKHDAVAMEPNPGRQATRPRRPALMQPMARTTANI